MSVVTSSLQRRSRQADTGELKNVQIHSYNADMPESGAAGVMGAADVTGVSMVDERETILNRSFFRLSPKKWSYFQYVQLFYFFLGGIDFALTEHFVVRESPKLVNIVGNGRTFIFNASLAPLALFVLNGGVMLFTSLFIFHNVYEMNKKFIDPILSVQFGIHLAIIFNTFSALSGQLGGTGGVVSLHFITGFLSMFLLGMFLLAFQHMVYYCWLLDESGVRAWSGDAGQWVVKLELFLPLSVLACLFISLVLPTMSFLEQNSLSSIVFARMFTSFSECLVVVYLIIFLHYVWLLIPVHFTFSRLVLTTQWFLVIVRVAFARGILPHGPPLKRI